MLAAYLNEVHFNPLFGNAGTQQYVELRSDTGSNTSPGTYLVVIGSADGVFELGDIHTIFDLSNQQFGSNGMLVLLESGSGYAVDSAARVLQGTDGFAGIPGSVFSADAGVNSKRIRTGSNTFLLIQSNVAPSLNNDIDINDDGTPDGAYLNWTILDGFTALPWVENVWPQKAYAPIVFQEDGVGTGMPGATLLRTEELAYVGRIGQSTGFSPNDWLAGNTTEDGTATWNFQLEDGLFGVPRPRAYAGRHLDHLGGPNWVGSLAGSVFLDLNSDGMQQSGERPIPGARIVSDLIGDGVPGVYAETIEPNNYLLNRDLTNISFNATLTTAGSDNLPINFNIWPVQKSGAPAGQYVFSHSGVGFFNEDRRLRTDFYRPARSISIDVIGNSSLTSTYGRLEIFDAAGLSLGFVRSGPLGADQVQRLSLTSLNDDIAYAVAYSENSYLSSSPFGMLDGLSFEHAEQSTLSDAQGNYFLQPLTAGSYAIHVVPPANYDQVFPSGGNHAIAVNKYESYAGRNFGLLGDLPPELNDQTFHVSEASLAGSVVATLSLKKGYPSQVLSASITSGDPSSLFSIDPTSGNIKLNRAELDFETKNLLTLNVSLVDNANATLRDSAVIVLAVDDANEPPRVQSASKSLPENTAVGTVVATMTAVDPDASLAGQVTWSIRSGNTGNAFAIDPISGEVRVSDTSKLDYETTRLFNLAIRATDRGAPAKTGDANLAITLVNVNEAPVLVAQDLFAKENSVTGGLVGIINAVDPDANESLHWQIVGGSGAGLFQIGASDAKVTLSSGASLDFEKANHYELIVNVSDSGTPPLSDTRTYSLAIDDVNEPPSVPSVSKSLLENSSAGTVVATMTADDGDAGLAGQITWSILAGNTGNVFAIDSISGEVRVNDTSKLDFETAGQFNLTVRATDRGVPAQTGDANVSITLVDVNEAPVLIAQNLLIKENSLAGVLVGVLDAIDPDANESHQWQIVGGSGAGLFQISANAAEVSVLSGASLDYEKTNRYDLIVNVTDSGTPPLSDTRAFTIAIADVGEAPLFTVSVPLTLKEDAGEGTVLGISTATDQDIGQQVSYSLLGNAASKFSIHATSGQIKVASGATFDFESAPTLLLTVKATDNGSPPQSTTTALTVQVTDVNEAPRILSTDFDVAENSSPGTVVGNLDALDPDASDHLRFEIIQQSITWLAIDPVSGTLTVAAGAAIDFETLDLNTATVRVTDVAGLRAEGTLRFHALDRNDAPRVAIPLPNAKATAQKSFSYSVPTNSIVDQDAGDSLSMAMTTSTAGPLPSWLLFNATTGLLSGTPTTSDGGILELQLTATDSSGATASSIFTVTVDANPFPWHNTLKPLDTNANGSISPIDALLVINFLNSPASRTVPPGSNPTNGYLDTSKDNVISPLDALLVINNLNKRVSGEGEAVSRGATQTELSPADKLWVWDYLQQADERKRREELIELLVSGRN